MERLSLLRVPPPLWVRSGFAFHTEVLIPPDQATQIKSPAHWDSVKIALIKSIRTGAFFDRKYWARHSTSGDVLKPVYFSSTIMKDKREHIKMCTS